LDPNTHRDAPCPGASPCAGINPSTPHISAMHKLDWARLAGFLLFSVQVAFALPVLPGIAGHGTDTPAGRGGIVYRVTNLNNSGPGSLRFGIEDASMRQPRVIVFEVAGVIELESDLIVRDDSFGQYGY